MKLFLLTDNIDTATGMRLAGVEYELVKPENSAAAIESALQKEDLGVLILSQNIAQANRAALEEIKRKRPLPLIVDLPDINYGKE